MTADTGRTGLFPLDTGDRAMVRQVADMHKRLLPTSPIGHLGYAYMTGFHYSRLVASGLMQCDVYLDGGKCAGFVTYTRYPFSFIERGKKRYFFRIVLLLLRTVLANPPALGAILRVMGRNRKRKPKMAGEAVTGVGEILSMGVEEDYRTFSDPGTGMRVPNLLFESGLNNLRAAGCRSVRGEARRDNTVALLFYVSYGFSVSLSDDVEPESCLINLSLEASVDGNAGNRGV